MAAAPTITDIRGLAGRAAAEAGDDPLTLAEIRQLTEVATGQAREVESYAARLAQLLTEAAG